MPLWAAVIVYPNFVFSVQDVEPAIVICRLRLLVQNAVVHRDVEDDEPFAVGVYGLAYFEVRKPFALCVVECFPTVVAVYIEELDPKSAELFARPVHRQAGVLRTL